MEIIERKHQSLRIAKLYQALGYQHYYSRIQQCMNFAEFVQKEVFTPEYYRRIIKRLNLSFAKWVKWKSFPALGWLKSLEISLSNGMVHPHFHILLLVDNNYFRQEDKYLSQMDWQASWKKAAKLAYDPVIDIRAVPPKKEKKVVPELLKYSIKPKDLAEISCDDLFILTNQVHNLRIINKGGILRKYFRNLGDDNIDLIGVKGDNARPTGVIGTFSFQDDDGSYIYQQNDEEQSIKISLINNEIDYSYC